jgi:hypothetical protein
MLVTDSVDNRNNLAQTSRGDTYLVQRPVRSGGLQTTHPHLPEGTNQLFCRQI